MRVVQPHHFQVTMPATLGFDDSNTDSLDLETWTVGPNTQAHITEADRIIAQAHRDEADMIINEHIITRGQSQRHASPNSLNTSPTPLHDHLDNYQLRLNQDAALSRAVQRNLDPLATSNSPDNSDLPNLTCEFRIFKTVLLLKPAL